MKKFTTLMMCLMAFGVFMSCKTSENQIVSLGGEWIIETVGGKAVTGGEKEAFLGFNENEKRIYGNASCNSLMGGYVQKENHLEFDHVGVTRMLCREMETEEAIIKAINETQQFRVSGNTLILYDNEGGELMMLEKK